jgi:SAM-dependent methyltransferase
MNACPVCNSEDVESYLEGDDAGIHAESVGSSRTLLSHGRILRCKACGLGYRSFRPRDEELAALYRAADDSTYEAESANRLRTALCHKRLVERYADVRGGEGDRDGRAVLDVGCASGAFLQVMQAAGWRVYGVEPAAAQYVRAKALLGEGSRIQQCVLQDAAFDTAFDLVTLFDVLEHVVDPVEFLALTASRLKDGGHLLLNVPRIDSLASRLLGERWPLLLAEHLNYFTLESLRICGSKAGIELLHHGQRPAAFSLSYVFFRAGQHGIPGTAAAGSLLAAAGLGGASIPVWLGEVYAVFRKLPAKG